MSKNSWHEGEPDLQQDLNKISEQLKATLDSLPYDQYMEVKSTIWQRLFANAEPYETEEERMWFEVIGVYWKVRMLPDDMAYIVGDNGVASHDTAKSLVAKLEKFYDRVSPQELQVMNHSRPHESVPQAPKTRPAKTNKPGYVYLLREINGMHYKIGKAKDPKERMKVFSVKLPYKVEYACLVKTPNMAGLEKALHARFADKRVDGEWFALDTEDVNYIKQLAEKAG